MRRRKRRTRRAARSLTDRIAIGAIALSAGLLLITAISSDRSSGPGSGVQARSQESAAEQPGKVADQRARLARREEADAGETGNRDASAQATPPGRSDSKRPLAEARSTEAETPIEGADSADRDTADLAALESNPGGTDDASPGQVSRAQFTTGIDGSEPVNSVRSVFSTDGQVFSLDGRPLERLYYFTEIENMQGETVTHRWEHEGEVVAETSFDVAAESSPIYSSENLPPAMPGEWRVVVTDTQGNVIRTDRFSYQAF
ncbi:MAG: DUF2914 domain-containing protein [Gammaproteobacteria bacterium]